ncbi:MAG TPA: peptide-methionine (S)-S-oxide reductase [Acholeplasmatales bacterium]|nr:MAG: peptide-methionine (S)-S-oxide reductase [Tenericutes bacterium GWF2_57_13]HAQ56057.1 peptide-methionine (S)-S-oxide reductase [Acholeplasmatales bacterium]
MKTIILAGGCFWGVEAYYARLKGVLDTAVGYTDAPAENPSYQDVCRGSGHAEVCRVTYDEAVLPLQKVLEHFFRIVDPTQKDEQGHDRGVQYRNGIYYVDSNDRLDIEAYVASVRTKYKKPVHTFVKPATPFYEAEGYHQDYLDKNPGGYCHVDMSLLRPDEIKPERRTFLLDPRAGKGGH